MKLPKLPSAFEIDSYGFPLYRPEQLHNYGVECAKSANMWESVKVSPPDLYTRVLVVARDAEDNRYVTTAHFNGHDKKGAVFYGAGKVRHFSEYWMQIPELP